MFRDTSKTRLMTTIFFSADFGGLSRFVRKDVSCRRSIPLPDSKILKDCLSMRSPNQWISIPRKFSCHWNMKPGECGKPLKKWWEWGFWLRRSHSWGWFNSHVFECHRWLYLKKGYPRIPWSISSSALSLLKLPFGDLIFDPVWRKHSTASSAQHSFGPDLFVSPSWGFHAHTYTLIEYPLNGTWEWANLVACRDPTSFLRAACEMENLTQNPHLKWSTTFHLHGIPKRLRLKQLKPPIIGRTVDMYTTFYIPNAMQHAGIPVHPCWQLVLLNAFDWLYLKQSGSSKSSNMFRN